MLNKRSAAQKANSNTVVSGRVLNKAKKPWSVSYIFRENTLGECGINILKIERRKRGTTSSW